ncbi:MAG: tRNA 2-thiocytidine biosynthesis TtcA family protein [Ruminiclostridium sp.]
MQKIMGYVRRAVQEFRLIDKGDKIAVGISGGKDSLVLLSALAGMRRFEAFDYDIAAVTIDPGFNGTPNNYDAVARLCDRLLVPFYLVHTQIGEIVFDIRKEPNPCSLCANMRRGALHDAAKAAGCNKLALGHHNDDVIETFMMNLLKEGRIGCFSPKTHLDRKDITVIRPLVFAPESQVSAACKRNDLEVVKSVCPADKTTVRQQTKEFLADMERRDKGVKQRIFSALRKSGIDGWGYPDRQ